MPYIIDIRNLKEKCVFSFAEKMQPNQGAEMDPLQTVSVSACRDDLFFKGQSPKAQGESKLNGNVHSDALKKNYIFRTSNLASCPCLRRIRIRRLRWRPRSRPTSSTASNGHTRARATSGGSLLKPATASSSSSISPSSFRFPFSSSSRFNGFYWQWLGVLLTLLTIRHKRRTFSPTRLKVLAPDWFPASSSGRLFALSIASLDAMLFSDDVYVCAR